ncbi:hypothetical protein ACNOYE_01070 [Nannocystaceae bacterium ST9]
MSWIFSFLLLCYATVRLALWMRGQWRWLSVRDGLPVPPAEIEAPEHLSPGLALLFSRSRRLRIDLTQARRMLATVEATDPDAALGQVRDARYRRALMESWTRLRAWVRESEALGEADRQALADLGLTTRTIAELIEGLHDRWRAVSRARALDVFPLADLQAVRASLDRAELELVAIEDALARVPDHPYRDRFAVGDQALAG